MVAAVVTADMVAADTVDTAAEATVVLVPLPAPTRTPTPALEAVVATKEDTGKITINSITFK